MKTKDSLQKKEFILAFDSSLQRQAMAADDRHGDAELTFFQQQQQNLKQNKRKSNKPKPKHRE